MIKYFLLLILLIEGVFAEPRTVDCNKIFDERKEEIYKEIEKLDEEQAAFESLKSATNAMLDQKQAKLDAQSAQIEAKLKEVTDKEAHTAELVKQNEALLASIKDAKDDKLAQTYDKMKDAAAGEILNNMEPEEAAQVLFTLKPKKTAMILAKMEREKASKITVMLKKGPPFGAAQNNDSEVIVGEKALSEIKN